MFIITTCQFNLDGPIDMIEQELAFATRCPSGVYLAPIIESIQSVNGNMSHRVRVLIEILADHDRVCDALLREIPTSSISFDSLEWHQNRKGPVEGVVIVDDAVGSDLAEKLSSDIDALAAYQVQSNNIDYHPNSNEIVRDLVHPGLYSYVKGVTPVQALNEYIPTDLQQDVKKDFWGRQYEDSVYQWLPTYFLVLQDGKCIIQDYINNLTPQEQPVNSNLYDSLARLFERLVPYTIESVFSYVCSIQALLRTSSGHVEWRYVYFDAIEIIPRFLRGKVSTYTAWCHIIVIYNTDQ